MKVFCWRLIIGLMVVLGGCVYDSEHGELPCATDDDCTSGAACVEGYCVLGPGQAPDAAQPEPDATESLVVARVEVAPREVSVAIGVSVQLTATAFRDDDSEVADPEVLWASADEGVARVDRTGKVIGVAPGTTTIVATVDDASASATVTVLAPVDSVVIEPQGATLGKGRTLQMTARVLDANGDELSGRTIDWSSGDVSVAMIDETGLVTGLEVGTAVITATAEGISGSATVEVTENPVVSVAITPEDGMVELGMIREFTAELRDADGESLDPRNREFAWTITNGAVAALSTRPSAPQVARVQGQMLGSTSISVTVDGAVTADRAIEVMLRPVASLDIVPLNEVVPVGSTRQLTTRVLDMNGQPIADREHTWSSSDDAVATIDTAGILTAHAPGTATISVGVADLTATLEVNTAFLLQTIDAGDSHTCGLNPDGVALCWGKNDQGQLGAGAVGGSSATPVVVSGGHVFTAISAGRGFTCAIDDNQGGFCWGKGDYLGTVGGGSNIPVAIPTLTLVAIAAGAEHACALASNGALHCWGKGGNGQLGDGLLSDSDTPVTVSLTPNGNITSLAAGKDHNCAATDTGKTYCWGNGSAGALGNGSTSLLETPGEVVGAPALVQLALGEAVSCGRTATSDVYCWGSNLEGRLGIGDMNVDEATTPVQLPGTTLEDLALGAQHGCGINAANDIVVCWGSGTNFRLGNNSEIPSYAPTPNASNLTAIDVTAGGAHSCAIDVTNVPYCWGNNSDGRAGTTMGSTIATPMPVWPNP